MSLSYFLTNRLFYQFNLFLVCRKYPNDQRYLTSLLWEQKLNGCMEWKFFQKNHSHIDSQLYKCYTFIKFFHILLWISLDLFLERWKQYSRPICQTVSAQLQKFLYSSIFYTFWDIQDCKEHNNEFFTFWNLNYSHLFPNKDRWFLWQFLYNFRISVFLPVQHSVLNSKRIQMHYLWKFLEANGNRIDLYIPLSSRKLLYLKG